MNRYYDAGIPIEYWLLSMDDFKGAPELKKAYEFIIGSINDFYDKGTTVCFAGNHGCGKTYTASALLRFVCQKNFSATYTTFADVISSLIDSPFEEKYNSRKQLLMSDFLVLDELDPRHIGKGLAEDLFGRSLDGIFRTRLQNHLPTIIITNSPNVLESFSGSIKESLGSLMSKMKTIVCRGDDYRKAGK
jgi:DNA replication protein DnaC